MFKYLVDPVPLKALLMHKNCEIITTSFVHFLMGVCMIPAPVTLTLILDLDCKSSKTRDGK